ncbi:unnamed protein product [Urochloa humidicola]
MEGGDATTDRKRKAEEPAAEDEDSVKQIDVVEGSKHRDGTIYMTDAHPLHELFHLADTRETRLTPMRLSNPTPNCYPRWTACRQHQGSAMLQIFSLKLAKLPSSTTSSGRHDGGPVHLYGFIAIRDLLDPLRNYVFNRSRDDPLIIPDPTSDPFIYLSGPKRGVYLQSRVLIEYDVRIKVREEEEEEDDLPLIDGAATVSELGWAQSALTSRIPGELGAVVDLRRALLRGAVEATVEVRITKQRFAAAEEELDLEITGSLAGGELVEEEIKLFRGVVCELCALVERFVVAARLGSYPFLLFKGVGAAAATPEEFDWFAFRVASHGCASDRRKFEFATVEVKVTWSSLC